MREDRITLLNLNLVVNVEKDVYIVSGASFQVSLLTLQLPIWPMFVTCGFLCWSCLVSRKGQFIFFWFGGHISRCLELTLDSGLRDHSWQPRRTIWDSRDQSGSAMCKASALHVVLLFLPRKRSFKWS